MTAKSSATVATPPRMASSPCNRWLKAIHASSKSSVKWTRMRIPTIDPMDHDHGNAGGEDRDSGVLMAILLLHGAFSTVSPSSRSPSEISIAE